MICYFLNIFSYYYKKKFIKNQLLTLESFIIFLVKVLDAIFGISKGIFFIVVYWAGFTKEDPLFCLLTENPFFVGEFD